MLQHDAESKQKLDVALCEFLQIVSPYLKICSNTTGDFKNYKRVEVP
jgi:hypothetical protein